MGITEIIAGKGRGMQIDNELFVVLTNLIMSKLERTDVAY